MRSNLTVNLGVRYDNQYKSFNNQLDLTPVPRLRELMDPPMRGDHNNIGPRARVRVGLARRWTVGGARGSGALAYQYVMASADCAPSDRPAPDQHRHQQPIVSGSVRRPVARVVCVDGAAERQHHRR